MVQEKGEGRWCDMEKEVKKISGGQEWVVLSMLGL